MERVHLKFCKWLLKVRKSTCNDFVYGELGRYPLLIERKVRILKYWLKIVQGDACLLVKKTYLSLYNSTQENRKLGVIGKIIVRNGLEKFGTSKECLIKQHSYGNVDCDFMINGYHNGSKMLTTPLIVYCTGRLDISLFFVNT